MTFSNENLQHQRADVLRLMTFVQMEAFKMDFCFYAPRSLTFRRYYNLIVVILDEENEISLRSVRMHAAIFDDKSKCVATTFIDKRATTMFTSSGQNGRMANSRIRWY